MAEPMTTTGARAGDGHVYNDDLLLSESERQQAESEFSSIYHVLDDPDLRDSFKRIDERANNTKRKAQRAGFWAVIMTVVGLGGAASEPKWHLLPEPYSTVIAICSALMCLGAVALVLQGGLYGKRKHQWLLDRMRSERLRQFHFQTFIARIDAIAAATPTDAAKVQAYRQTRREAWLNSIKQSLEKRADSKLEAILGPDAKMELWIHDGRKPNCVSPAGFDGDALFRAYGKLRFQAQLDYANHKLRKHDWEWHFRKMSLAQQRRVLSVAWIAPFVLLIAVHVIIVAAHMFSWGSHELSAWLHICAIWLALVALGARTIEHGLAIAREIERYEDYRASTRDLRARFDAASSNSERLVVMSTMETHAFEEMRNFLRAHHEASFTL